MCVLRGVEPTWMKGHIYNSYLCHKMQAIKKNSAVSLFWFFSMSRGGLYLKLNFGSPGEGIFGLDFLRLGHGKKSPCYLLNHCHTWTLYWHMGHSHTCFVKWCTVALYFKPWNAANSATARDLWLPLVQWKRMLTSSFWFSIFLTGETVS